MLETCRKAIEAQLRAKGCEPGWYQAQWRGDVAVETFDSNDCMLAVLDALCNAGSVAAWAGDGTSCVVQMIALAYRDRDYWRSRAWVAEEKLHG